ncbi:MAG: GrpB family protein [bacterium]|nr:GrpB family protein [bacterium]
MELQHYNSKWNAMYQEESNLITSAFDSDEFIDVQHIGSTAITDMASRPIIDIAVLVTPDEFIQGYVRPLSKIGYTLDTSKSSPEQLFFVKGDPVSYHLTITQEGMTPYWDRHIALREYLTAHTEKAKEYESLKRHLLELDPSGGQAYVNGKSAFISNILQSSQNE